MAVIRYLYPLDERTVPAVVLNTSVPLSKKYCRYRLNSVYPVPKFPAAIHISYIRKPEYLHNRLYRLSGTDGAGCPGFLQVLDAWDNLTASFQPGVIHC